MVAHPDDAKMEKLEIVGPATPAELPKPEPRPRRKRDALLGDCVKISYGAEDVKMGGMACVYTGVISNPFALIGSRIIWGETELAPLLGLQFNGETKSDTKLLASLDETLAKTVREAAHQRWQDYKTAILSPDLGKVARAEEQYRAALEWLTRESFVESGKVAVKTLKLPSLPPEDQHEFRRRHLKQYAILRTLDHPNIVKTYGLLTETEFGPVVLMEYLRGKTLSELQEGLREQSKDPRVHAKRALEVLLPIARALDYCHRHNVIHRDVKSNNIMVTKQAVKLIDFGISKDMDDPNKTMVSHKLPGTPAYAAPEYLARHEATPKLDSYGWGMTLYELLAGKPAYALQNPQNNEELRALCTSVLSPAPHPDIRQHVPLSDALAELVNGAIDKDAGKRWGMEQIFARGKEVLASKQFYRK